MPPGLNYTCNYRGLSAGLLTFLVELFRADLLALKRPNPGGLNETSSHVGDSSTAGRITGVTDIMRRLQLSATLRF